MFPQQIDDRTAYLGLVSSLVPWQGIQPWMQGLRLIFRDETAPAAQLAKAPRVRFSGVNLGPDAMEDSIAEDVEDEALPDEQRMQSLLSLATLDYAHSRTPDALAKYEILLGYYQKTENLMMQAVVINSMGDIYHRMGDLDKAQHWYECAVPPAVEAKQPAVMATVSKNLGDVAYKRQQYPEAEQYYDGLDKLAAHLLDVETKIRALEWRGLSQERQRAYDRAVGSWEAAVVLSRNIGLPSFLRQNLEHLGRIYRQLRMTEKLAAVEAELRSLETEKSVT